MKYLIPFLALVFVACELPPPSPKIEYKIAQTAPDRVFFGFADRIDSAAVIKKAGELFGRMDGTLYVWPDSVGEATIPMIGDPHTNAEAHKYAVSARKVDGKMNYYVRPSEAP